ncbi:probable E3 ubiquitin-protein ligase Hul4p [Trichomonascus vanleenenianus]|uniref:putative E3 ubiquitin-protein ligase HUL4 n=1 Tax=Trichomonascus vanleenenianus TaxID=2268995 RepID=UPI003EC9BE5F
MPSWSFFRRKSDSGAASTGGSPPKHKRNASLNVSTMSSMGDILKSVSQANAEEKAGGGISPTNTTTQSSRKEKLVFQKCICCGTRLQVPDGLPYFKCSICDTFHDANPAPVEGTPISVEAAAQAIEYDWDRLRRRFSVDSDVLAACTSGSSSDDYGESGGCGASRPQISQPEAPPEFRNLEALIRDSFGSVEALNASFRDGGGRLSYSRPPIDLAQVDEFYKMIVGLPSEGPMHCIVHTSLGLVKRLRHSLSTANDVCFLLVILENPIFYDYSLFSAEPSKSAPKKKFASLRPYLLELFERTVAVLSHSPKKARHYLLNWMSRYPTAKFLPKVELLNAYIAHRLTLHYNRRNKVTGSSLQAPIHHLRNRHRNHHHHHHHHSRGGVHHQYSGASSSSSTNNNSQSSLPRYSADTNSHVSKHARTSSEPVSFNTPSAPTVSSSSSSFPFNFRSARPRRRKNSVSGQIRTDLYRDDWRIAVFLRVLAVFFNANTVNSRNKIPISTFYNTMVDFTDIFSDFDEWQRLGVPTSSLSSHHIHQSNRDILLHNSSSTTSPLHGFDGFDFSINLAPKVAFCQYPFMLSMGSKTQILEHDARRQMECKAQEAFFGSLDLKCPLSPYLYIRVNRETILQDSFEAFETHENDLKKSLRIEFIGEPGVDAGGLRKEWFLLLLRDLFNPTTGIFTEEEESRYCWFDAGTEHPLKYYKLTGVAIGLALYNSTILDVNFPPVMFKKLLSCPYTLDDFAEFKPSYGKSLKLMLDYQGDDFEEVFGINFCVTVQKRINGELVTVEEPLMPGGEEIAVTKQNRSEYVKRVMGYHLDVSIRREFEAFKQGFYNVAGGNALSLFSPDEIELLVRGSPDAIDVDALRSVTKYQHWGPKGEATAKSSLVVNWFWQYFKNLSPEDQRKLLIFVTGSDRIPATGIANMSFRISKIGEDCDRLPTSHTCFNQLCLYEYSTKQKLEEKLTRAIYESQGFGIK